MTLLAAVMTMVLGVGGRRLDGPQPSGRRRSSDRSWTCCQTLPAFVYLIPALALFGAGRFLAIVAAVAYAAPVAIKIAADGIRGVSPTTVEAAEAAGSNRWQMIGKVQLPMARGSLVLAANQGLLFVLSMVVIGGLVGGGGLGFLVVSGFSQMRGLRQGAGRRHRHHRPGRDARPHHRPHRRPLRARRDCLTPSRSDRGPTEGDKSASDAGDGPDALAALAALAAWLLAACGGGDIDEHRTTAATPAAADCGEFNMAINPWVGYEASAYVVGEVAAAGARLRHPVQEPQGGDRLAGLRHRRGRRRHRELGSRRPQEEVHRRAGHGGRRRAERQHRLHRLVRAAVAGRGRPGRRSTGRTSTTTPTSSPRRSPAARASSSPVTRPSSPTTRRSSRTSTWTSRSSTPAARPR